MGRCHNIGVISHCNLTLQGSWFHKRLKCVSYPSPNEYPPSDNQRNDIKMATSLRRPAPPLLPLYLPFRLVLRIDHPSYYHMHIHVVHTDFSGSDGMAVGKAWLLDDIIEQLPLLGPDGFKSRTFTVIVGEETDLWKKVYSRLRPQI